MNDAEFFTLVETTTIELLDAPTPKLRQAIIDNSVADPDLSASVLMLLAETIQPRVPDVQPGLQKGLLQ